MSASTSARVVLPLRLFQAMLLGLVLGLLGGCGGGGGGDDLTLSPAPGGGPGGGSGQQFDFSTATLTLIGPDVVSPNSSSTYRATLVDGNGQAPPGGGLFIGLQPTQGTITPPGGANTDSNGEVPFTYSAPNADSARTETIRANVSQGSQALSQTLQVVVTPDTFRFVSPAANTTVQAGQPAALEFEWLIAAEPVDTGIAPPAGGASQITLEVTGGGGGGGFIVGGAAPANPVMVDVVDGDFSQPVQISAGTTGGGASVMATANGGFSATLRLSFVGAPADVALTATPATITSGGASNLSAVVTDNQGTPLNNISVRFSVSECAGSPGVAEPCGSGQQIDPGLVTDDSNANGQAVSIYRSGTATGTATVSATVDAGPGMGTAGTAVINVNP